MAYICFKKKLWLILGKKLIRLIIRDRVRVRKLKEKIVYLKTPISPFVIDSKKVILTYNNLEITF